MSVPNYDWRCADCGHEFELWAPMNLNLVNCPQCHALSGEKQPSAPPVHFKGAGWTPKSGKGRSE